jgi:hypothetical protein
VSDWLAPIRKILVAETGDLRKLAEAVGANPQIFYVGRDLSKCDLRGQDLRGMDFTGASLNPALMDDLTRLDPAYDPRFRVPDYVQIGMREEVLAIALAFADATHYVYKAWAIKALLETGVRYLANKEVQHVIESNPLIRELYRATSGKMRRLTVLVQPHVRQAVAKISMDEGRRADIYTYNQVIISALVRQYIMRNRAKDYASIQPLEMFAGAQNYLDQIRRGKRFVS